MNTLARLLIALAAMSVLGCATYTDSVREAQADVRAGRPDAALEHFDERLETESWRDLPADLDDEKVLLLLERATLLQATGEYATSARDMVIADQRLEWLDIDAYDRAELARWLYSDDAREYRAPAYERLLLNTLNMVNFLALRDYEGARVEARRFTLIEDFFTEEAEEPILNETRALGHYFGGVAFEYGGDWNGAIEHYERAWKSGMRAGALRTRLIGLYRLTGARAPRDKDDPTGLADLKIEAELKGAMRLAEYRREYLTGDTLIVSQTGLAPYKKPMRVPIGDAWIWAGSAKSSYAVSPAERARGQALVAQGVLKWVNLPVLTDARIDVDPSAQIFIDGRPVEASAGLDVANQVVESWKALLGPVVASAITRAITRAVAGGATRVASTEIAKQSEGGAGLAIGAIGLLASLAVEGGMAAADTPDTRSWTTLPGRIRVWRGSLEPGAHQLAVSVGGRADERSTRIDERGLNLVNFSRLR